MNGPVPPHPLRFPAQSHTAPMRKRMERREERNSVRFLTFSCQRRLPLLTDPVTAADFTAALATVHRVRRFELFAWVVMPEHVHLLLRPDQDDTAAAILKSVKLTVAQLAIARWKRSGDPLLRQVDSATGPRFCQKGGGFDRNVRSMTEFTREVGYIHANPVRRGLVTRATEWSAPLSSVHAWLARHRGEGWTGQPGIDMPPGDRRWDWLRWKGFMQWKQEQAP